MSARDDLRALYAEWMRATDPRHIETDADRAFLATYAEREAALRASVRAEYIDDYITPPPFEADPNIEYERRRDARLVG